MQGIRRSRPKHGACDKSDFIEKISIDLGTLDGSLEGKGCDNATEGSAMAVTNANVGDIITFDYSFSTNDYQPYKDFSFFS